MDQKTSMHHIILSPPIPPFRLLEEILWKMRNTNAYCTPLHLAQSTNCIPPYTLLANRTPTVKAMATDGTCFAIADRSTKHSSPFMI